MFPLRITVAALCFTALLAGPAGMERAAAAPAAPAATYSAPDCRWGYYSALDAQEYLNLSGGDNSTCPVRGMFTNRHGYFPVWAFETNVANDYGLVMVKQGGGCSWSPDTGPFFDFQLPCKAHDYCYDLRRAGFSATVSDGACDYAFFLLMDAHCDDRFFSAYCLETAAAYYAVVLPYDVDVAPAEIKLVAYHSGQCANVAGASTADGQGIVQYPCVGASNERFRLRPAPGYPGWFQVQAVHSGKCVDVGSDLKLRQYSCAVSAQRRFAVIGAYSQNIYTLRSAAFGPGRCWDVPGSAHTAQWLIEYTCSETSNQLWRVQ